MGTTLAGVAGVTEPLGGMKGSWPIGGTKFGGGVANGGGKPPGGCGAPNIPGGGRGMPGGGNGMPGGKTMPGGGGGNGIPGIIPGKGGAPAIPGGGGQNGGAPGIGIGGPGVPGIPGAGEAAYVCGAPVTAPDVAGLPLVGRSILFAPINALCASSAARRSVSVIGLLSVFWRFGRGCEIEPAARPNSISFLRL